MSKRHKTDDRVAKQPQVEHRTVEQAVKPRRYTPKPCPMCSEHSGGESYSFVNGTETRLNTATELIITRSCKCRKCGNTWPEYTIVKHKSA